ncbi:MAG TPA: cupin domain-containing protein [Gaiellaceae bacterium]|nr:cupin domain-containing protein [Gaiellaceae bacterium]
MATAMQEQIRIGGIEVRFLLEGEQTGGSLAMFEFGVAAGTKVPAPHSHDGYDETIYGLDGVLTWTVGGETHDVGAGQVLTIPRGVVHGFDNAGESDARALAVVTPGILGAAYFRETAEVIAAAAGGPPDLAALGEVMRRHGLTPAT